MAFIALAEVPISGYGHSNVPVVVDERDARGGVALIHLCEGRPFVAPVGRRFLGKEALTRTIPLSHRIDKYPAVRWRAGYKLKVEEDEPRRFARLTDGLGHRGHLT